MGLFGLGKKKEEKKEEKQQKPVSEKKSNEQLIREKVEVGYIYYRAIIEMVGKPKEYIEDTLRKYVENISENKDYTILKKDFSEAKDQEGLFSVFVELEMLTKNLYTLVGFCIDFMPSSIEIIEPERSVMSSNQMSNFFNDLQGKLHHLDMIVKNMRVENTTLKTNAGALLRNLIMLTLAEKSKTLKEISDQVGIPSEQLKPFIESRIKEGFITKSGDKYSSTLTKGAKAKGKDRQPAKAKPATKAKKAKK